MLDRELAKQLTVVVPAYNEEAGVAVVLEALQRDCPGAEVIVVDDASTDGTSAQVARFAGVQLVRLRYNRGQGNALKVGMRQASRRYVAWFDADNEHRNEDLVQLVERIVGDDLIAVIGQRTTPSVNPMRAIGKGMIRMFGRRLKVRAGSDLNCGLRVFRRSVILRYLSLVPERFSASLMTTLIMVERGYPIAFVPVTVKPRIGTSGVSLKDGFEAILMLVRAILIFAPMRVFFPLGVWSVAIGLAYGFVTMSARHAGFPVGAMLRRPKGLLQAAYDFVGAPLRMIGLPDHVSEQLHLTSLRAERFSVVLAELRGRTLDVGAGDNALLRLYQKRMASTTDAAAARSSVGVDVVDWGGGCTIISDCRGIPFPDQSFDTVSFVACLNHIPEREAVLAEAARVLRPGGRLVVTMLGRLIGAAGHAIWWYSEDKHREVAVGEVMGLDPDVVVALIRGAGFDQVEIRRFGYRLNRLFLASKVNNR